MVRGNHRQRPLGRCAAAGRSPSRGRSGRQRVVGGTPRVLCVQRCAMRARRVVWRVDPPGESDEQGRRGSPCVRGKPGAVNVWTRVDVTG